MSTTKEIIENIEERLGRDIPMEVTETHVDEYICPKCGAENNTNGAHCVADRYCPECGQRLKTTAEKEAEEQAKEEGVPLPPPTDGERVDAIILLRADGTVQCFDSGMVCRYADEDADAEDDGNVHIDFCFVNMSGREGSQLLGDIVGGLAELLPD